MRIIHYVFGFCLIAELACDSGNQSVSSSQFGIYRLKDSSLTANSLWNRSIEDLTLADRPFLTQNDLSFYRWQTHEFSVTASVDTQLAALKRAGGPVGGIPFVVTVGNDRIYLGAFWYAYSSLGPQVPYIDVILDAHQIRKSWSTQNLADERNDPRIYLALKTSGILIE